MLLQAEQMHIKTKTGVHGVHTAVRRGVDVGGMLQAVH